MLDGLTAGALEDAASRRESVSYSELERRALETPLPLDAYRALSPATHLKVIAEVKRASPSRGAIAAIPDVAALARDYSDGGADAISVLTEQRKFGGSLEDVATVRAVASCPILRKDFVAEEYQLLEARAYGADIALLIVAALDQSLLARLHTFAHELSLSVLVETHSADEVRRANDIGASLIGVNARDLTTFELDRSLFGEVRHLIADGSIAVAESAVSTVNDARAYRAAGADVILVGEALVVSGAPADAIREMRSVR